MIRIYIEVVRFLFELYRPNVYEFRPIDRYDYFNIFSNSMIKKQIENSREIRRRIIKSLKKSYSPKQKAWRLHLIKEINFSIVKKKTYLKKRRYSYK